MRPPLTGASTLRRRSLHAPGAKSARFAFDASTHPRSIPIPYLSWESPRYNRRQVCGVAWEQVRALVDYLTLRARVIELEARVPPRLDVSSPIKSPGGG